MNETSRVHEIASRMYKEIKKPLYLWNSSVLRRQLDNFNSALPSNVSVFYATMANDSSLLLRWYRAANLGVFVGSMGHLDLVERLGYPKKRITAGMTNLLQEELEELAVRAGTVLLDSEESIRMTRGIQGECEFLVRVDVCEPTAGSSSAVRKMGLPVGTVRERWSSWKEREPRLKGLHSYSGTNVCDLEELAARGGKLIALARELEGVETVDLGGGFGICGDILPGRLELDLFWRKIRQFGSDQFDIRVEPGRFLVAPAAYFVVGVKRVTKEGDCRVVGTDGSIAIFPRRFVFGAPQSDHPVIVASIGCADKRDVWPYARITGNSTFSQDVLYEGGLPAVAPGDVLMMKNAGAYCRSASLRFLGIQLPDEFRFSLKNKKSRAKKGDLITAFRRRAV